MDYLFFRNIFGSDNFSVDYSTLVDFFKYVSLYEFNTFEEIRKKSRYFKLEDYLYNPVIGCYYDIKNEKIVAYKLSLPYIEDVLTLLINVHETVHALIINSRINHPFDNVSFDEYYPMLYEKMLIKYINNDVLTQKYDIYLLYLYQQFDDIHRKSYERIKGIESINFNKCKRKVLNL